MTSTQRHNGPLGESAARYERKDFGGLSLKTKGGAPRSSFPEERVKVDGERKGFIPLA